jgi:NADPH-dependent curcumin reductase CurA
VVVRKGIEVHLARRPVGRPRIEDFSVAEVEIPEPGQGQVLVRNRFLQIDPGTRLRTDDQGVGIPLFGLGEPLDGVAVGEVLESNSPELPAETIVRHRFGWREYVVADAGAFQVVDTTALPTLSANVNTGLTGYVGIVRIAETGPGDTVFVSSAAGAVGGIAGQVARLTGAARVVGSAGSPAKVAHVVDRLRFDAAFDYHDGPVVDRLRELAPNGIDVYFDNVGGEQLEAAIEVMNPRGRIVLCGAMTQQNGTERPSGPRNLIQATAKGLTLRGFTVRQHLDLGPEFTAQFGRWLRAGEIHYEETVIEGLEKAPEAFLGQLRGEYLGQLVLKV